MKSHKDRGRSDNPARSDSLPPPRDPELAVREEYEIARAAGTIEALELFIARHPENLLAAEARTTLARKR